VNKPTVNYWLDLIIGIAFIASAVSGIVFLLPFPVDSALGINYANWDKIHTWGSLLMIGGVFAHLALHWKWLTHMTRKTLLPGASVARSANTASVASTERRGFLRLVGYTALVASVTVAGYERLGGVRNSTAADDAATTTAPASADNEQAAVATATPTTPAPVVTQAATTVTEEAATPFTIPLTPTATPAPTPTPAVTTSRISVACRKGQVNCPFPGRCHSYRDANGNGYCDLSQPP